jgi:hypothetical protein
MPPLQLQAFDPIPERGRVTPAHNPNPRTDLMKKITMIAALMLGTTTLANAGIFDLPAHQQNGFRDTGCDESQRVAITNDAGEVLYWNNESCASVGGSASHVDFVAAYLSAFPPAAEEPEEEPAVK